MKSDTADIPILRTKLHRPPVVAGHLHRQRLLDRLEKNLERPLTLVSAPAGYGKTTVISCWLESCGTSSAWISLDKNDNDLRLFCSYFIAAFQSISPGFGREAQILLNAPELPTTEEFTRTLINELDQIKTTFILVLDDYHLIKEKAIHNLVAELLVHPPASMHLVLVTRRDPPLPMTKLRARSRMTEIRTQELRLSLAETATFLQQMTGKTVDDKIAAAFEKRTEGWVTGLRLAALSLREREDLGNIMDSLPDDNRYVMDYLIAEILSVQPPAIQDYLLSSAILNRFCAELCEAVCTKVNQPEACCSIGGKIFISQLEQDNLFVVPLDNQGRWYRYHHLFQRLLQRQMKKRYSPNAITKLHKQAGDWFVQNNLPDEALQHFLTANDIPAAKEIVIQNRHALTNQEQWHRLEHWIGLLPKTAIDTSPELLVTNAWLCENRLKISEMIDLTIRADSLITGKGTEKSINRQLSGEIAALKAARFFLEGKGMLALSSAKQALKTIPEPHASERAFALLVLAFSHQMTGSLKDAFSVVYKALDQADVYSYTYRARLMFSECFINWIVTDLKALKRTANQVMNFGQEYGLMESTSFAHYFLGIAHYCLNDIEAAEKHLVLGAKQGRISNINTFVHSSFALALSYQTQGLHNEAQNTAEAVIGHAIRTGNSALLKKAQAFQAELALRQGRNAEAVRWAQGYDPDSLTAALRFYIPQLTLVKVLIVQGTKRSIKKAANLLNQMKDFYSSTHNTSCLIHVLALSALLYEAQGNEAEALSALGRALTLAEPGGLIRPFLDLGPKIMDLLSRLVRHNVAIKYVGQIITDFRKEGVDHSRTSAYLSEPSLGEILTNREIDIITLLAQRMTNKEIAKKLFISPLTVKKHSTNIYSKLSVKSRQEAVDRAKALGII